MQADGSIGGPLRIVLDAWAYRDATLIVGAQSIHAYDLGYRLLPDVLRLQDPASGAVVNDRLGNGDFGDDADIPYTCGVGFAALACGQLEPARRVAAFLRRMYLAQPDLPDRFFPYWSVSRQALITPSDPGFPAPDGR